MKKIIALVIATLPLTGCSTEGSEALAARTDRILMEELRGSVATGPSVSCVSKRLLYGNRSAGEGAIIFNAANRLFYVNRPPAGCPELGGGRTMITQSPSSRLCEGDIVTILDPIDRAQYGSCSLGKFTPYRKVR